MVNYGNVIQVGVAMLMIIFTGFTLAKLKILKHSDSLALNNMVFWVGFFPLLFEGIASKKFSELNFYPCLIAGLMSISIYIALTPIMIYPFSSRIGTYLATAFPAAYVNYVVSGIPVFNSIWPAKENMIVSMTTISNHIVSSPIYYILVGIYKIVENNKKRREEGMPPEKFSFKILVSLIISIFKSPILVSVLCGIAYSATGLKYVPFLDKFMEIAGNMVYANALLCVGIFLAQHSLIACNWLQFIFCMFSRFIIGPFFALLWCKALKLSNRLSRQCVIICAQPTAVASYAITCNNKLGEGVASTMIFWTSILLVPFIILWFFILDRLNIFVE